MARPEVEPRTPLGARLREVRRQHGDPDRGEFAKILGVSKESLASYERGDNIPDAAVAGRYRDLGVDLNWLLTDKEPPTPGLMMPLSREGAHLIALIQNSVIVPRYDIQASAGRGKLVQSQDVSDHFAVSRQWLLRNLPGWASAGADIGILEGSGDSMEPTVRDGDIIMLVRDPPDFVVERGGIFVLTVDGRLLLKRLHIHMNGDLSVISDNKEYPVETIPMKEVNDRVIVHGQVFFTGGKPRTFAR